MLAVIALSDVITSARHSAEKRRLHDEKYKMKKKKN